ncbi:extracellular matrix protein 2 isoform X2 [Latimeria chalumnae]|uniref:extracellular matrix protein 2 isoform X2 n=1 Tax=Latimeria chalumnae TaxID=7897 RepID=UPI0003C17611|nr:PREDICTED: extracellular matrix protein 2 isoform X2 [Latimeria chalumnae]|eukprot:XP_005987125.1 PREDICTED: extracellular matrix protein 2 isoform X2 [Latimeria chalumnae]
MSGQAPKVYGNRGLQKGETDLTSRPKTCGPRRRGREGGSKRTSSANDRRIRQSKVRHSGSAVPLVNDDGSIVTVIDSYLGVDEFESSYNVLPVKKGHCMANGMIMYDKAVWSPKPCIICLCNSGNVACDEIACPLLPCQKVIRTAGECCPVCTDIVDDSPEFSGDSSEPNDPSDPIIIAQSPRTQAEIDHLLWMEEQEILEEEQRLHKKEQERKRRRERKKKLEEEKRKKLFEARRREEEELRKMEEEEEEIRKKIEEEKCKLEEEKRKKEEQERKEEGKKKKEHEKKEEEEEEEEEQILRGDVFRMLPRRLPVPEGLPPPPVEIPSPPVSLPPGCVISDITVSCINAKLTSIPSIVDPELKSLNLAGNAITAIPAEAFNGVPNLEWIDLSKNKITSAGIDPQAFKKLKATRLYMDANLLEQIPPELPSTLEELRINENNLSSIAEDSFQGLTILFTLELEGNKLNEATTSPLAFKPLKRLSYLRFGRNKFRTVPQGLPPSIEELYLESNQIEEISETAFNKTTNLNIIVLRNNNIDETRIAPLAWINHKNLESIDLSYNKLHQVPSFLPRSLVHLVLVGNQIEGIPGYVFAHMDPGIEYLYLSYNKLDDDGIDSLSFFGAYRSLREVFLDYNNLKTIPSGIAEMRKLHFLRLNNNKISNFPPDSICNDFDDEDSSLVTLRLENNYINTRKISPTAFSCIQSYSSVVLKPQNVK